MIGARMRKTALAAAMALAMPMWAQAQDTATPEVVEQLSSDYTAIAGGWWLDEKCRVLPFERKIEFEWLVGELTEGIAGSLSPEWASVRQQSAREIAQSLPCDEAGIALINDSVTLARVVTEQLTGLVFTPGVTDREYLLGRYSALARGLAVADRCRFQNDSWRNEYRTLLQQIGAALAHKYGDVNFPSLAKDAQLEVDQAAIDCTPAMDGRIQSFYAAARALGGQLGLIVP